MISLKTANNYKCLFQKAINC